VEEIVSMTLKIRLTTKGQICPLDSMKRIIEETVGIQPIKPFCYLPNIVSNSVQEGRFRLFSEAADARRDTATGGKEVRLSASGHQPNRSAILDGVFQGTSSSSDTRPTNTYSRTSTSESSGYTEIKIHDKNDAEEMAIQYTER
jgi:hypothetical protein